jgi:hypothetical protein
MLSILIDVAAAAAAACKGTVKAKKDASEKCINTLFLSLSQESSLYSPINIIFLLFIFLHQQNVPSSSCHPLWHYDKKIFSLCSRLLDLG